MKKNAHDESMYEFIDKLDSLSITAVTRSSESYPQLLAHIYDPPIVLYVKGRLKSNIQRPISIIGSRKPSRYGLDMAEVFAQKLAERGFCVVSGMAIGCDSAAAKGALKAMGNDYPTIAVLGSGVNVVYPPTGKQLYDEIISRGAVISEFLPNSTPTAFSFPQRNRIISGLSKGVLVIEAGEKSGTMITVDFAQEQGRDVFAIPGRLTDRMSMGTNSLIKSGYAKPVFDIEDILYEYGMPIEDTPPSIIAQVNTAELHPIQQQVYEILLRGERNVDELCDETHISMSELNTYLTEMELSGIIKQLSYRLYSV